MGGPPMYRQKTAPQGFTGPPNPQGAVGGQVPVMGGPQMYAMGMGMGMGGGIMNMGPMGFGG